MVPLSAEIGSAPTKSLQRDTLQLYLHEIGKVKLLTREEEIELAQRIQRGEYEAREQMITANLRLVVKIARDYEGLGLPLLDLINEGNIGLMKGVQRFKLGKGSKLANYAAWWIMQAIRRALSNQSNTVRLPVHVADKMSLIRKSEARLRGTLDREPTDEEIADDLGLKARSIRLYRDASRTPVSLDSPISVNDSTSIAEHVADPDALDPLDELVRNNDNELLRDVLASLDSRESRILAMRFGLDNGQPKSLAIVGAQMGFTRERIRLIQEDALYKMREEIKSRDPTFLAKWDCSGKML
jgi:RNA polymerase primary sigma factor